jgi:CheY-like chemotaxis protein
MGKAVGVFVELFKYMAGRTLEDALNTIAGQTVFIVDDEDFSRAVISQFLEEAGCTVVEADSGEAALDLYREMSPGARMHLAVLDFKMPGMNGLDAFRALKALNPAFRAILYTGHEALGRQYEDLAEGLVYLEKVYSPSRLVATLGRLHEQSCRAEAAEGPLQP